MFLPDIKGIPILPAYDGSDDASEQVHLAHVELSLHMIITDPDAGRELLKWLRSRPGVSSVLIKYGDLPLVALNHN